MISYLTHEEGKRGRKPGKVTKYIYPCKDISKGRGERKKIVFSTFFEGGKVRSYIKGIGRQRRKRRGDRRRPFL